MRTSSSALNIKMSKPLNILRSSNDGGMKKPSKDTFSETVGDIVGEHSEHNSPAKMILENAFKCETPVQSDIIPSLNLSKSVEDEYLPSTRRKQTNEKISTTTIRLEDPIVQHRNNINSMNETYKQVMNNFIKQSTRLKQTYTDKIDRALASINNEFMSEMSRLMYETQSQLFESVSNFVDDEHHKNEILYSCDDLDEESSSYVSSGNSSPIRRPMRNSHNIPSAPIDIIMKTSSAPSSPLTDRKIVHIQIDNSPTTSPTAILRTTRRKSSGNTPPNNKSTEDIKRKRSTSTSTNVSSIPKVQLKQAGKDNQTYSPTMQRKLPTVPSVSLVDLEEVVGNDTNLSPTTSENSSSSNPSTARQSFLSNDDLAAVDKISQSKRLSNFFGINDVYTARQSSSPSSLSYVHSTTSVPSSPTTDHSSVSKSQKKISISKAKSTRKAIRSKSGDQHKIKSSMSSNQLFNNNTVPSPSSSHERKGTKLLSAEKIEQLKALILDSDSLTPAISESFSELWESIQVVNAFDQFCYGILPCQSEYFFDRIKVISSDEYQPTQTDFLRSYVPTDGKKSSQGRIKGQHFSVIDLGGRPADIKRWPEFYLNEMLHVIVFVVSLDDCFLGNNSQKNHPIEDTLKLWEEVTSTPKLEGVPFALFLNKCDIFIKKLDEEPLNGGIFEELNPLLAQNYDYCIKFLIDKFRWHFKGCHMIEYVVNAVDSDGLSVVLQSLFRIF
eukprot:TRINITY_DN6504_c0_g1_i1.p1 TRINITY_DN6504_c0_g1~~TRINITY_DN6504_c0_g1_i1.p1  ORF type:complete len:724 (+),score=189.63 TRINITY_DN6504_c0_g1_i1:2161-4332(+)